MLSTMPFGKYKNVPFDSIPKDYVSWFLETVESNKHLDVREAMLAMVARRGDIIDHGKSIPRIPKKKRKKKYSKSQEIRSNRNIGDVVSCADRFNPDYPWPEKQEWDGVTAPWLDQHCNADNAFKEMFR